MDRIRIKNLEANYRIGVTDAERWSTQRLLLNIAIVLDVQPAAENDDLDKTIDYAQLCRRLERFGDGRQWNLIETLAVDICNLILGDFAPASVTVEVRKFVIPHTAYVSVRATRPIVSPQ